jgi:flagellar assembly protein FliH
MSALDAIELFEYAECADAPFVHSWSGWEATPDAAEAQQRLAAEEMPDPAELSHRIAEEKQFAFEAGRTRGLEEGRAVERAANAAALAEAREEQVRKAVGMVADFERNCSRYFHDVEREVVKLALAVAARILHREAQTDPLLLMGAVRVALGQIAASTEVRIRVPSNDLDLWTEAIALLPNLKTKPKMIGVGGMQLGECAIETKLGNADLGIPHQLAEIERDMLHNQSDNFSPANAEATRAETAR